MVVKIFDDFNLQKIIESGQCFRCCKTDSGFRFITGNHVLTIKQMDDFAYDADCSGAEWDNIWKNYFDLERDYKSIRSSFSSFDFLGMAADEGNGIRILRQDPWETIVSFIISQRKSIPAIKTGIELLCRKYGNSMESNNETIYLFPSPEAIFSATEEELGSCGLGYRVPYVKDAAQKVYTGLVNLGDLEKLDNQALRESLKTIKGIGNKVADCVMLFAYGRTSSVPIDIWIKKIIQEKYNGENPFPLYDENAGILQQYAFYYIQKHKWEVR
ncbi:MAG: hypothetical protein NC419_09675 [Muribaculaceae bacterium]|nr:hypothetical protein [Muribaculaceae bacterium]